jgi:hypothetical protein
VTVGERGPTGDHGQEGPHGATGERGAEGRRGPQGVAGKDILSRMQTLALFGFVVLMFTALAWRVEHNTAGVTHGVREHDRFVNEVCTLHPDFAPETCAAR